MRRLPDPADCRLSEGDRSPEALFELFRDWRRTQTQSSVTALQGPRQQMDVWFCRTQEPMPGGIRCALSILEVMTCTLSQACPGHPCLRLTDDLHGCRQYGHFEPVPPRASETSPPSFDIKGAEVCPSSKMPFSHAPERQQSCNGEDNEEF